VVDDPNQTLAAYHVAMRRARYPYRGVYCFCLRRCFPGWRIRRRDPGDHGLP